MKKRGQKGRNEKDKVKMREFEVMHHKRKDLLSKQGKLKSN